jgi:hypothetical protein
MPALRAAEITALAATTLAGEYLCLPVACVLGLGVVTTVFEKSAIFIALIVRCRIVPAPIFLVAFRNRSRNSFIGLKSCTCFRHGERVLIRRDHR